MANENEDGFVLDGQKAVAPGVGEVLPDSLNIHSSLPTQVGIIKPPRYELVNPINSIDGAKTIEFQIHSHMNELIDPLHTYLYMEVRVIQSDGTALPAIANPAAHGSQAFYVNGLGYNLFKSCNVRLNDQPISTGDSLYAYRGDFETKLMWPKEVKQSLLKMSGYEQDDGKIYDDILANEFDWTNLEADAWNAAGIKQWKKKYQKMQQSHLMYIMSKIHSEIFDQPKLLPPKSKLYVSFELQDRETFSTLTPLGAGVLQAQHGEIKVEITKINLLTCFVTIDPDILMEMMGVSEIRNAIYPIRRIEMKYHTKTHGGNDYSIPNLIHEGETLPRRIFIAFVRNDAFTGDRNRDPFNYLDIGISHYALKIGGEYIPYPEIAQQNSKIFPLFALLDATGALYDEVDLGIDLDNYATGNNFLAFDLTNSKSQAGSSFELPATKSVNLEITLTNPINFVVTMIVYAEYDAELEISKTGSVKKKQFGAAI